MSGTKRQTPLFELIGGAGTSTGSSRDGGALSEVKPRVRLVSSPDDAGDPGRSQVVLPMWGAFLGVTIILGGLSGVWSAAYRSGFTAGSRQTAAAIPSAAAPPGALPSGPPTAASGAEPGPSGMVQPGVTGGPEPGAPHDEPAASGDPRTPGLNYLVLISTLNAADAKLVVDFLARNGFSAAGVPVRAVDRGGTGSNNRGLYKVVSLTGVTREQFRAKDPARTRIEGEAARLSAVFQKEHPGKGNFGRTYWELLSPPAPK